MIKFVGKERKREKQVDSNFGIEFPEKIFGMEWELEKGKVETCEKLSKR